MQLKDQAVGEHHSAAENQRATECYGLRYDLRAQDCAEGEEEQRCWWRQGDAWGLRSQGKSFSRKVHPKHCIKSLST